MISEEKLLKFKWTRDMPSYFKNRKKIYRHEVVYVSKQDLDTALVLPFPSKPAAQEAVRSLKKSLHVYDVWYERKELPTVTEEGYIL